MNRFYRIYLISSSSLRLLMQYTDTLQFFSWYFSWKYSIHFVGFFQHSSGCLITFEIYVYYFNTPKTHNIYENNIICCFADFASSPHCVAHSSTSLLDICSLVWSHTDSEKYLHTLEIYSRYYLMHVSVCLELLFFFVIFCHSFLQTSDALDATVMCLWWRVATQKTFFVPVELRPSLTMGMVEIWSARRDWIITQKRFELSRMLTRRRSFTSQQISGLDSVFFSVGFFSFSVEEFQLPRRLVRAAVITFLLRVCFYFLHCHKI